jgi:hypothetical protein
MNMRKLITSAAVLLLPLSAFAAGAVNMPSDSPDWTPLPQMEIGKVKRLSKDQLPPTMKKMAENDLVNAQRGYEVVPEEFFIYGGNYRNRLRTEDDIKAKVNVALADIKSTELNSYVYEGMIPDGPTLNGPWTNVIRVFKRDDGVVVMLNEWDYVADGGAVVTINEVMNAAVGNVPAMLSIKKSPSGKTATELAWATSKKYFTLTVWDDVDGKHAGKDYNRKWLLNLANSLM